MNFSQVTSPSTPPVVDYVTVDTPPTASGKAVLDHVLYPNTPATPGPVRHLKTYDNSLARIITTEDTSTDDDSDDNLDAELVALSKRANMGSKAKDLEKLVLERNSRSSPTSGVKASPEPNKNNNNNNNNNKDAAASSTATTANGEKDAKEKKPSVGASDRPLTKSGLDDDGQSDTDDDSDDLLNVTPVRPGSSAAGAATGGKSDRVSAEDTHAHGASPQKKAIEKKRDGLELAKKLRFLGKQFNQIDGNEVKQLVNLEKGKREEHTSFEWETNEQKPKWKDAILLSTRNPGDGLKLLIAEGLLKNTSEAKAKWLSHYRRTLLDNPVVIEWVCLDYNEDILHALVDAENDFSGLDADIAFRRFVFGLDYLPAGDSLKRLLDAFGTSFNAKNAIRKEFNSAAAVAYIANGCLALNNMYHINKKQKRLRINDFVTQSAGQNGGQDFNKGFLEEVFANVVSVPLTFEDSKAGYQKERRHGWVSHKLLEAKSWKKYWAVLTDKGELFLIPEDGTEMTQVEPLDLTDSDLKATRKSEKFFFVAFQIRTRIHVLQVNSEWAADNWTRHLKKFARPPGQSSVTVSLKDAQFSPSPIRDALKGKQSRRLSTGAGGSTRATLRLGGASAQSQVHPDELADDDLPEGALDAVKAMNDQQVKYQDNNAMDEL